MIDNNFPPNTNPNVFSLYAVAVAIVICDDFNMNELNSIGNWIMLLSQYLLTFSAQQQLIEGRIDHKNININSKQAKKGGTPYDTGKSNQNTRLEVDYLIEAVKRIEKELEEIKKNSPK